MPKLFDITPNSQQNVNVVAGRDSGMAFVDSKVKDPNGSQTPEDRSFSIWQNAWKTLIKMFQGNITLSGSGNVSINAAHEVHTTAHNMQTTTSNGNASYTQGPSVHIKGTIDADERAKLQQYHAYLDQITQASQDAIANTPGEKVSCPNCAQKHLADDKSDNYNIIFDYVAGIIGGAPWLQGPFEILRWLVNHIYVPLLGVFSNLSLNMGKGCGPGCDGGTKEGLSQPLAAGQTAVQQKMEELAGPMNDLTASMKSNSGELLPYSHGLTMVVGDPQGSPKTLPYIKKNIHHSYPMNIRPSPALTNKLRVTTEGNCKTVIYQPPLQSPFGNLMMNVQNNVKITSGNAGMDFLSTGEIAIKGGSVHINGSQGEVSLTSSNVTTIGGGNVLISADPKNGDSGVCIDSKSTFVRGAFNVNGDSAMLGSLTLDGALNVNYINCPTMAAPTSKNGTDSFTTHGANWQYIGLALNELNFATKLLNMGLQLGEIELLFGITVIIMETYNSVFMAFPIEILPTGIFVGVSAGFGAGVCAGYVWNYPHNHTVPPDDHTHTACVPRGGYYKKTGGSGMARATGNPSPTPAPTNGTFLSPHHRGWGGGCGGGGLYSKVRNQTYGVQTPDNAFNGGNFVTATVTRNPDGSIYPPPDLTYRIVNDKGGGNGSTTIQSSLSANFADNSGGGGGITC